MAWFTNGILTNPATDAILADTGALAAAGGPVVFKFMLGANIAAVCTVEQRNAANSANISSQVIAVAINQLIEFDMPCTWAINERYRIRLNAAIVGSAQASIITG